jgi:hypothetical protein
MLALSLLLQLAPSLGALSPARAEIAKLDIAEVAPARSLIRKRGAPLEAVRQAASLALAP